MSQVLAHQGCSNSDMGVLTLEQQPCRQDGGGWDRIVGCVVNVVNCGGAWLSVAYGVGCVDVW